MFQMHAKWTVLRCFLEVVKVMDTMRIPTAMYEYPIQCLAYPFCSMPGVLSYYRHPLLALAPSLLQGRGP